jgi:phage repressor protein C with HTH and peptisase S24 domain
MLDSKAFISARKAKGLSQTELAAAAKVSQQLIASIETGGTRTTKYLMRLAKILEVTPEQLDPEWTNLEEARPPGAIPGSTVSARRDLPIHASGEAGGGSITIFSDPVDWLPRPPLVAQVRNAYGLYVTGESMVPEFEPGDIALVNPHLPLITETTCIFYQATKDETHATIKRLRRLSDDTWYLRQWNPPARAKADFTLARKEWPIAHRLVGKYSRG